MSKPFYLISLYYEIMIITKVMRISILTVVMILIVYMEWWWYSRYMWRGASMSGQLAAALIYLAGVIAISAVAFQFIEEPANRLIRRWLA